MDIEQKTLQKLADNAILHKVHDPIEGWNVVYLRWVHEADDREVWAVFIQHETMGSGKGYSFGADLTPSSKTIRLSNGPLREAKQELVWV